MEKIRSAKTKDRSEKACQYYDALKAISNFEKVKKQPPDLTAGEFNRSE